MTSFAPTLLSQATHITLSALLLCGIAGCEDGGSASAKPAGTATAGSSTDVAGDDNGTPAAGTNDISSDNPADTTAATTAGDESGDTSANNQAGDAATGISSTEADTNTNAANNASASANGDATNNAANSAANTTDGTDFVGVTKEELQSKLGSDGVYELTFDDIKFEMETGGDFEREMIGDPIESLAGQKIRIRGYIYPTTMQRPKSFILVRDNMECCFGPGAALYDCVRVEMKPGQEAVYTTRPVAVEGTFSVEVIDFDGMVMSIYRLDADAAK